MYTYPEALNALQRVAIDLLKRACPKSIGYQNVSVIADSVTGTASVDWHGEPSTGFNYVTIHMPVKPATYRMSANEFDAWAAYLLHEVGHPLHTAMPVWKAAVAANRHQLLNSLEDVREEKATIDANIAVNALEVFSKLVASLHAEAILNGYDPNHVRSLGWTMSTLGRHANGYQIDVSDITNRLDPNGVVAKLLAWAMPELMACKNTADCDVLTQKITKALASRPKVKGEENDKPRGKAGNSGKTGEAGEASEGEGKGGEGEGKGGEGEGKAGLGRGAGGDGKAPDFDEHSMQPNRHEVLKSTGAYRDAHSTQRALNEALRQAPSKRVQKVEGKRSQGWSIVADAARMGRQRALLARAIKRNETDEYEGGRTHGRFDARAITKALAGSNNVFGKRTITEGYDTDVQILVDGSGSMSGLPVAAASTLALVIAQAASQVGVDCAAHIFTDNGLYEATSGKRKPDGSRFDMLPSYITGGTPLAKSLIKAALRQAERAPNKRKILFVITDGGDDNGPMLVKAAGEYVEKAMGIEIANLHIGSMPMKIFRNECAVDVSKVSETGLRQMVSLLEKGI